MKKFAVTMAVVATVTASVKARRRQRTDRQAEARQLIDDLTASCAGFERHRGAETYAISLAQIKAKRARLISIQLSLPEDLMAEADRILAISKRYDMSSRRPHLDYQETL